MKPAEFQGDMSIFVISFRFLYIPQITTLKTKFVNANMRSLLYSTNSYPENIGTCKILNVNYTCPEQHAHLHRLVWKERFSSAVKLSFSRSGSQHRTHVLIQIAVQYTVKDSRYAIHQIAFSIAIRFKNDHSVIEIITIKLTNQIKIGKPFQR